MIAGLPLTKSVLTPLAKNFFYHLNYQQECQPQMHSFKKNYGLGRPLELASRTTTLIISNEEKKDIMRIVKSLDEFTSLVKGISVAIKNEQKN